MSTLTASTTQGFTAPVAVTVESYEPLVSDDDKLRAAGHNPKDFEIETHVSVTRKADGKYTYKFRMRTRGMSLPTLMAMSKEGVKPPLKQATGYKRAVVIALADLQLGKVGGRGGTEEALARIERFLQKLLKRLRRRKPTLILLLDVGDGLEGFEAGGNPMGTNDLSLPQQLDAYAAVLYRWVCELARISPVIVAIVPSNHAAWRNGKQSLGNPSDDFGIHVHRQVQRAVEAHGLPVTWVYPDGDYEETLTIDVYGTIVGLMHGHQVGPGPTAAADFWQKQTFGEQPLAAADVVVMGHYHHFWALDVSERRSMFCAPTLDNGSDWFRLKGGRETKPGLLVLEIDENGLNEEEIVVLRDDFALAA